MSLKVVSSFSKKVKKNFVVFASKSNKNKLQLNCKCKDVVSIIEASFKSEEFTASAGETMLFRSANVSGFENLLIVGLGKAEDIKHETLRRSMASAYRALKASKQSHAGICFPSISDYGLNAQEIGFILSESIGLTSYSFDKFLAKKAPAAIEFELDASAASDKKSAEKGAKEGKATSEGTNFARYVSDCPPNYMNPVQLAKDTQNEAKGLTKLKVTVWDETRIKKEKMGSLLGVAQGSTNKPRVIILEYKGAAASKKPICFVGKGLTFDAGGISLKPGPGMDEMKYDMCGGANVIGAMIAIAKLGLKVNVTAYVGAVENMPDGNATRPGDILTARSGKTIEVLNTDAEGRLVLADLLVYASEKKPASIFNIATLTGAMVMALGYQHVGLFSKDDKLAKLALDAADRSGEDLWRMPLVDEHLKLMKGTYADLQNIGKDRGAGSAQAAAFLTEFVLNDVPFAHFDMATQMSNMGKYYPYCPDKGAGGAMVRTFIEFARQA